MAANWPSLEFGGFSRRRWCLAASATLFAGGCAARIDAQTKAAVARAQAQEAVGDLPSDQRNEASSPSADPWRGANGILTVAIDGFASGNHEEAVLRLMQARCGVQPEPREGPNGPVYLCYPEPDVRILAHLFVLELAPSGVIGLLATDLSETDSVHLLKQARDAVSGHCLAPWREASSQAPEPEHPPYQVCPVDAGATLALGRYPGESRGRWVVAISVLGSG